MIENTTVPLVYYSTSTIMNYIHILIGLTWP